MRDIYDQLGVRKYINAYGTVTKYGGSIMDPLVLDAMREASRSFVDLVDLQQRAGKRLAELLGVEAAYITTGAAAGIVLSVAACITGNDPEYIRRIPNTEGMKNEIIILKAHSCQYEQQVRQAGGNIVEIGQSKRTELWELNRAINPNTAGILYFAESAFLRGSLPLKDIISVAKERNVPVLVDAAAEIPPVKNLTSYLEMGADLVQFSGGKDIRGPQSSGFIIGKKHLIEACALNSNPHAAVGRPFKVDKETIVGLLKAVEIYLQQDFDEEMKMWAKQTDYIADQLSQISELGVRVGLGILKCPPLSRHDFQK